MKRHNIAIVGSRGFDEYEVLEESILSLFQPDQINKIISGGAIGTDTLAEQFSSKHNVQIEVIKPEWNKYGRAAGPIRNKEIMKAADFAIVFWDGSSKGTLNDLKICYKQGISHTVFFI